MDNIYSFLDIFIILIFNKKTLGKLLPKVFYLLLYFNQYGFTRKAIVAIAKVNIKAKNV